MIGASMTLKNWLFNVEYNSLVYSFGVRMMDLGRIDMICLLVTFRETCGRMFKISSTLVDGDSMACESL
jgi:hypothetical protein